MLSHLLDFLDMFKVIKYDDTMLYCFQEVAFNTCLLSCGNVLWNLETIKLASYSKKNTFAKSEMTESGPQVSFGIFIVTICSPLGKIMDEICHFGAFHFCFFKFPLAFAAWFCHLVLWKCKLDLSSFDSFEIKQLYFVLIFYQSSDWKPLFTVSGCILLTKTIYKKHHQTQDQSQ